MPDKTYIYNSPLITHISLILLCTYSFIYLYSLPFSELTIFKWFIAFTVYKIHVFIIYLLISISVLYFL